MWWRTDPLSARFVAMRIPALLLVLSMVAPLTACESDEQKLARLQQDQAMACFEASRPSHQDSAAAMRIRCDLATRNLNAFMSGK